MKSCFRNKTLHWCLCCITISFQALLAQASESGYTVNNFTANAELICEPEVMSSIIFDKTKGSWKSYSPQKDEAFNIILKRSGNTDNWTQEFPEAGFKTSDCKIQKVPADSSYLLIKCNFFAGEFVYYSRTTRFVQSAINGYIDGDKRYI